MCTNLMHQFLAKLPKCEHHMHLEGSLEPDLEFQLASRNGIRLPQDDPAFKSVDSLRERYSRFTSLDDFLHYYFIGMSVLTTQDDFESLAYSYFTKANSQNVRHAEVFFDPQAHTSRGISYRTVLDGFRTAQKRAAADYGITSELIVCILRHLPTSDGHRMYVDALPDLKSGAIRGLGLSSTERGHPPANYKEIYAHAKSEGITHLTAHAGEEADVSYMAAAVHDIGCIRVDHGIKLPDDTALMREFAQRDVLVTMCPISNVELKCVKSIADLPIRQYLDNGVPFSINSDDPAYFGGGKYILDNYYAVQDAFHLSREDWFTIVRNAIRLSWCSDVRKHDLMAELASFSKESQ